MSNTLQSLKKVETAISELTKGKNKLTICKDFPDFGKLSNLSEEELVRAYASIIVREEAFTKAVKDLEVDTRFTLVGYTGKEWKEDIKTALYLLRNKTKLEKLNTIKAKLEELLDKEDKQAQVDEELNKLLG